MERPAVDLVVGVDFGMTCTGVSYANLSIGAQVIKCIQKWPGRSQANENKVPTILSYPIGESEPSSWGFLAEAPSEQNKDHDIKEWFKTYLDPKRLEQKQIQSPEDAPQTLRDVEDWYEAYLRRLYRHIELKLEPELRAGIRWNDAKIEFLFSVPTTWDPHPAVENFKHIAERAGFGKHPNHSVKIWLTEAEAAAVHISSEAPGIFRDHDVLLVCDAGGGTTDLSLLRVTGVNMGSIRLQQLSVVYGDTIGSVAIDYGFERLTMERLQAANSFSSLGISIEEAAWTMMKSREFQNTKCEHGDSGETPLFSIRVPELSRDYTSPEYRIQDGEMVFRKEDLQALFDKQLDKLFRLIDNQLDHLKKNFPHEEVSHLVLSGGLGNSPYVQSRLRNRYASLINCKSNALNMKVRVSPDPQLAVCKGMVADRVRTLQSGHAVLGWRCCRSSYGTSCRMKYDKTDPRHLGEKTFLDPIDKKQYLLDCVKWFIKKGEPVSSDQPIVYPFRRKIRPGDPRNVFNTRIVQCDHDAFWLPLRQESSTRVLCTIKSDLSGADEAKFIKKNKHFWKPGEKYYVVDYEIRVIVGAADLTFELWFDGQKLSKDNSIQVEWLPVPPIDTMKEVVADEGVLVHELERTKLKGFSSSMNLPRMSRGAA